MKIKTLAKGAAAISVLAIAGLQAGPAWAQGTTESQNGKTENPTPPEEIIVTGIRGSIAGAINRKRNAGNLIDVVNAEDIGKLPDQNVAESLGRIPGISISRKDGEGSNFTVRGISLNRVEINGRQFVGPTQDATPALETVNPEILSGIDVIKSPTADLVEGAIGATINLRTRRPLDQKENTLLAARGQLVYSDRAEKAGYRASGLVSQQFGDNRFGVLLGLAYAQIHSRGDGIITNGWVRTNNIDGNADGVNDIGLFRPNRISSQIESRKDRRFTANGAIQWQPDDVTDLVLEGTYSSFKRDRDLAYYQLLLNDNDIAGSGSALPDSSVARARLTDITLRPLAYDAPSDLESYNLGFSGKRTMDRLTVFLDASYSRGTGTENQAGLSTGAPFTYVVVPRAGNTVNVAYDFNAQRNFPDYSLTSNFNRDDPTQYRLFSVFDGAAISRNRGYDTKIDLDYELESGVFKAIEAGGRYENLRLSSNDPQSTPAAAALLAAADRNGDGIITVDELPAVSYNNQFSGNFLPEVGGNFPRFFLTGDLLSVAQARSDVGLGDRARQPASERSVQQESYAGYAKLNLAGDIGVKFAGNIGLRYVHTRRVAEGNEVATGPTGTTITPTSLTRTFSDWLPSANLSFDLTDNLTLRLATARVVSRPALRDVAPGITVSLTNFTAASGNAQLEPIRAWQYDASLEWYFGNGNILAITGFAKDISTFIIQTTTSQTLDGYPPTAVNPSGLFQVSRPQNGSGGKVRGFEINYQHAFRFLPAPFDGLGVQANYTFATSDTPIADPLLPTATLPLPNLSRHTYSLVGYYENDGFSGRIAYTRRSKFLVALDSATLGGARYENSYGSLDVTLTANLAKNVRVTFDAINLNKDIQRQYNGSDVRLYSAVVNDTRYQLGMSVNF